MATFLSSAQLAVLGAVSVLVLSGCAADSGTGAELSPTDSASAITSPTASPSADSSPSATPTQPDEPVDDQPNGFDPFGFSAKSLNGSAFDVESLRGEATVLWFWTPWCTVCRADAPGIASLQSELGDRINFVGVAAQGTSSEMVAFASETGVTGFPHLADADSSIWAHFGVPYQPSYVFVSATGESTLSVGSRSISELELELIELIG